jgi:hypothetical protein
VSHRRPGRRELPLQSRAASLQRPPPLGGRSFWPLQPSKVALSTSGYCIVSRQADCQKKRGNRPILVSVLCRPCGHAEGLRSACLHVGRGARCDCIGVFSATAAQCSGATPGGGKDAGAGRIGSACGSQVRSEREPGISVETALSCRPSRWVSGGSEAAAGSRGGTRAACDLR